ncbi:universal stress protein [Thermodesulfobacteriota bacterium]
MKRKTQKKMLLAIDGSERSFDAVRYVSKFAPFHEMKVVLFNVFSSVPESYRDLEKDPQFSRAAREVMAWEMQRRKVIQEYMDKARETLVHSNFSNNSIKLKIQNRKKGIARDIIREAKNGYSTIVMGRRGEGDFRELVVGSVATKVVERASFVPVLLIGKIPPDENVLLAVDGSENANRAVDFVASTLGGFDFKVNLFHVIRGDLEAEVPHLFIENKSLNAAKKEIKAIFHDSKQRLTDAGFQSNQITTKVVSGTRSRAGAIIQEARDGDYGTIVLGRRGLSKVKEFFIGRVGNKVIHTIRNRAVWVVT